jgi:hypothetical protein
MRSDLVFGPSTGVSDNVVLCLFLDVLDRIKSHGGVLRREISKASL